MNIYFVPSIVLSVFHIVANATDMVLLLDSLEGAVNNKRITEYAR